MQSSLGLIIFLTFIAIVVGRNFSLKKQGIEAMEFGKKDKKDFIILPFALLYLYLLTAHAFGLPTFANETLYFNENIAWGGVVICIIALILFVWTMLSFQQSFRVGLVNNTKQGLITKGSFSISRNPIYVSFAFMLIGQFLISASWVFLIYVFVGVLTFHRQVLKEEAFLKTQYGDAFITYCKKVRRYL